MSYCSENKLPLTTPINRLFEVVELLGFQKVSDPLKGVNQIGSYVWLGRDKSISFVGIEMNIDKIEYISVQTRTRIGRSFWDLQQQNKTISLLKALFGGSFTTDEGASRYMKLDTPKPSLIACSLFVDRWVFNNAVIKPKIYLENRQRTGNLAHEEQTGFLLLDSVNPRILSNNMIIPFLVGCWESYFRNSYISILKYSNNIPEKALKTHRISSRELLMAVKNEAPLECLIANGLSFQRPNVIAENFRQIDPNIDIIQWLKKPYHKRKKTLFESVTEIISIRDSIVHTGNMDLRIMDKQIRSIMDDLTAAADRAYQGFGRVFDFTPDYSF